MNNSPIYIIVLFNQDKNSKYHTRAVGFCHDLDTAKKMIFENWLDIFENGYYDLAVIERMLPNQPYCHGSREEVWYSIRHLDDDKYQIEETSKPTFLESVINFGMG